MKIAIGKMPTEKLTEEFYDLVYLLADGGLLDDKDMAMGLYMVELVAELEKGVLCDQCFFDGKMAVVLMGDTLALCREHLRNIILDSHKKKLMRVE